MSPQGREARLGLDSISSSTHPGPWGGRLELHVSSEILDNQDAVGYELGNVRGTQRACSSFLPGGASWKH